MKKAVIIIPTYNEAKTIEKTLWAIDEMMESIDPTWKLEVLVVDDSSPDGTGNIVKKVSQQLKYVQLFTNVKKSGLGGAYLKGMEESFSHLKADVIFEFDADLSHDPSKIPEFLKKIDEGYDLVLGSRYIPGGSIPQNWGFYRKFLSVIGNLFIMTVLTDFRIRDWSSGYRAISKKVYDAVKDEMGEDRFSGYTFQIGFLHKSIRKGFKVVEVPFHFVDRTEGESKLGTEYIKNTLMYILKVRMKEILNHRLFKFAVTGVIGALVQLSSLHFYRYIITVNHLPFLSAFQEAVILSIENAILSNFFFSNFWTFGDRKLKITQLPFKFAQFHLTSAGSLLIQFVMSSLGERFIGLFTLFTLPFIGIKVDTGLIFAVTGIFVAMFWNFFAYNTFIWKKKK